MRGENTKVAMRKSNTAKFDYLNNRLNKREEHHSFNVMSRKEKRRLMRLINKDNADNPYTKDEVESMLQVLREIENLKIT